MSYTSLPAARVAVAIDRVLERNDKYRAEGLQKHLERLAQPCTWLWFTTRPARTIEQVRADLEKQTLLDMDPEYHWHWKRKPEWYVKLEQLRRLCGVAPSGTINVTAEDFALFAYDYERETEPA